MNEVLIGERVRLTADGRRQIESRIERAEARAGELRRSIADAREDRTAAEDERAAALGLLNELQQQEVLLADLRTVVDLAEQLPTRSTGVAELGSSVRVQDAEGVEETYTLVDPLESSPGSGRISTAAPLGRALIGRRAGDVVTVQAPAGGWHLLILEIGAGG